MHSMIHKSRMKNQKIANEKMTKRHFAIGCTLGLIWLLLTYSLPNLSNLFTDYKSSTNESDTFTGIPDLVQDSILDLDSLKDLQTETTETTEESFTDWISKRIPTTETTEYLLESFTDWISKRIPSFEPLPINPTEAQTILTGLFLLLYDLVLFSVIHAITGASQTGHVFKRKYKEKDSLNHYLSSILLYLIVLAPSTSTGWNVVTSMLPVVIWVLTHGVNVFALLSTSYNYFCCCNSLKLTLSTKGCRSWCCCEGRIRRRSSCDDNIVFIVVFIIAYLQFITTVPHKQNIMIHVVLLATYTTIHSFIRSSNWYKKKWQKIENEVRLIVNVVSSVIILGTAPLVLFLVEICPINLSLNLSIHVLIHNILVIPLTSLALFIAPFIYGCWAWLSCFDINWIFKSFQYMVCGSLMTFTLATLFLMFATKYLLSATRPTTNTQENTEAKWVYSFLGLFVVICCTIAYNTVEHLGYVIAWLCGFVASLAAFGFASDGVNHNSTELYYQSEFANIIIGSNHLLHRCLITVHRLFQQKVMELLNRKVEIVETVPGEEKQNVDENENESPRQIPSMYISKMIQQSSSLALGALLKSVDPPRAWIASTAARIRYNRNTTDIVLVTSFVQIFNLIMFFCGLFLNSKVLLLVACLCPLLGLFVGFMFDWNQEKTSCVPIQEFMTTVYGNAQVAGNVFFRGEDFHTSIAVYYCLTFFSLTFSSMVFIPIVVLLCTTLLIIKPLESIGLIQQFQKLSNDTNDTNVQNIDNEMTINDSEDESLTIVPNNAVLEIERMKETQTNICSNIDTNIDTNNNNDDDDDDDKNIDTNIDTNNDDDDDDKHNDVCVICWSDDVRGGKCSENHFTCIDCFNLHVESTFSTSNASNLDPRRMKSLGCKDGRLRCPQSFPSLGETNMCHSEPYDSKSLLTLLNPDNLTRVMDAYAWAKEQAMFEKKTHQYSQSIQCLAEKYKIAVKIQQDRKLLSEQIQREMPNARQCKECNYGPIDHGWCDNLKTHHGETKTSGGQISNACPKWYVNIINLTYNFFFTDNFFSLFLVDGSDSQSKSGQNGMVFYQLK